MEKSWCITGQPVTSSPFTWEIVLASMVSVCLWGSLDWGQAPPCEAASAGGVWAAARWAMSRPAR